MKMKLPQNPLERLYQEFIWKYKEMGDPISKVYMINLHVILFLTLSPEFNILS